MDYRIEILKKATALQEKASAALQKRATEITKTANDSIKEARDRAEKLVLDKKILAVASGSFENLKNKVNEKSDLAKQIGERVLSKAREIRDSLNLTGPVAKKETRSTSTKKAAAGKKRSPAKKAPGTKKKSPTKKAPSKKAPGKKKTRTRKNG